MQESYKLTKVVIVGAAGTYITHSFNSYVACENSRRGRFARRKVAPSRETSPAAKSEEKRLFSQANSYTEARKLNGKDFWETGPSGRYDLAVCFFWSYPTNPCFQWKVYGRSKVGRASPYIVEYSSSTPLPLGGGGGGGGWGSSNLTNCHRVHKEQINHLRPRCRTHLLLW